MAENGHGWRWRPSSCSGHASGRPGCLTLPYSSALTAPNGPSRAPKAVDRRDSASRGLLRSPCRAVAENGHAWRWRPSSCSGHASGRPGCLTALDSRALATTRMAAPPQPAHTGSLGAPRRLQRRREMPGAGGRAGCRTLAPARGRGRSGCTELLTAADPRSNAAGPVRTAPVGVSGAVMRAFGAHFAACRCHRVPSVAPSRPCIAGEDSPHFRAAFAGTLSVDCMSAAGRELGISALSYWTRSRWFGTVDGRHEPL